MAIKKITLSAVFQKDLRVIGFLAGSWAVGLFSYWCSNGKLPADLGRLSLIPIANYIAYRIIEELKNEGYREALKS